MSIQASNALFMVYPSTFGFDEQTAATNTFQHHMTASPAAIQQLAAMEFETYVAILQKHGIDVHVFVDDSPAMKPNAVFPNNWLTTWANGRIYTYPMATESRRIECSPAAIDCLRRQFNVTEVVDISSTEEPNIHLESTGAMVFDHANRIAYGCISPRCDEALFNKHVLELGYQPITFHAYDEQGTPVYHSNVLMGIQSSTAVVCVEAITNAAERDTVLRSLQETGHEVIEITPEQMLEFCGNVLEVRNDKDKRFLILSQTAYDAFTPEQRAALSNDKTLLSIALPTIETIGGGSARCMITEVFLPRK